MHKSPQYIFVSLITFVLLSTVTMLAQEVHMEYGVDSTINMGKYDRIYQVASEQKVDINTLIKFDAVQWGQIHPSVTIEQRLYKDFTIEPNITMSSFDWSRAEGINFALNPNLAFKYYFNRAYRERKGKNVIGFSADYFLVGFSYTLTDDKSFFNSQMEDKFIDYTEGSQGLTEDFYTYTSWCVMYGLQRKIGNMAYADFAFGGEKFYFKDFGNSKILPTIKIKLGFALSTEQFKRLSR